MRTITTGIQVPGPLVKNKSISLSFSKVKNVKIIDLIVVKIEET